MIDLDNLKKYKENNRIEAKRSLGGLPHSIWETYSAFANTYGGILLLGVEDNKDKTLHPVDLPDPEGLIREFWDIVNDKTKVSANILREKDVTIENIDGKSIIAIRVPRARQKDRPVYIGTDPYAGSYRRSGDGDYRCAPDKVKTMLRRAKAKLCQKTPGDKTLKEVKEKMESKTTSRRPVLYQIAPNNIMLLNCYVIRTAGGKYIVIDGGGAGCKEKSGYFYDELKRITKSQQPVIEAWIFSHMHDDHLNEFAIIGNDGEKKITVKKVYMNLPSREFMQRVENGTSEKLYLSVRSAYDNIYGPGAFDAVKGKTAFEGDVIEIDGVKIEILLTMTSDESETNINDTSMVFRVTLEGQTVLFLGDSNISQGNRLLEKYGARLKCTAVQMSHHGQNGTSREVYENAAPEVCLWPTPIWVYENKAGIYQTTEVRRWMTEMGIKHHFVAGLTPWVCLEFPLDLSSLEQFSVAPENE